MTRREQILAVFEKHDVAEIPVSVRLDLWHKDAELSGTLPGPIKGLSCEETEDYLGFCRAARYRTHPQISFRGIEITQSVVGEEKIERYVFDERALERRTSVSPDSVLKGHIIKYPLESEADYDVLLSNIDRAFLDFDASGFDSYDREVGEAGEPVFIVDACPAHSVMLFFAGYENFYYHLADFPEKVEKLISGVERIYKRELWPATCETNAKLILHGAHFSSQITPLPIFEKYFLDYFKEFNELMHQHDKKVVCHADAEMGDLLDVVLEAGFDGSDCLATTPLVPQGIEDYLSAWQDKIVCWGGLPGIIFDPSFPRKEYEQYVVDLVERTKGSKSFIFGASDNVMPGAEWERLIFLAEATGTLGRNVV